MATRSYALGWGGTEGGEGKRLGGGGGVLAPCSGFQGERNSWVNRGKRAVTDNGRKREMGKTTKRSLNGLKHNWLVSYCFGGVKRDLGSN